jgi:hypothetical protein
VRDDSTPEPGSPDTPEPDGDDTPVTLEQLAQLQAGTLDDATAAWLRQKISDDPELARRLAALERVRSDLAGPAPQAPADITARIGAALRAAPPPGHGTGNPQRRRRVAALAGIAALAVAAVIGTVMALNDSEQPPTPPGGPTAEYLKTPRHAGMPMSDQNILALLNRPPQLGPLADPQRIASCRQGLGYSSTTPVLGATTLNDGGPRVLLLLPATDPKSVMALLVGADCRATDAGLLADAELTRP